MKIAILDTSILIYFFKESPLLPQINTFIQEQSLVSIISVVSKAELLSISKKNKWGEKKIKSLHELLSNFQYIDIEYNNLELINAYADIDAFSQGKTPAPNGQMLNNSSRNMGKNDLWIAATTHALDAVLLTTDNDFDHLHNIFFQVKKF